MQAIQQTGFSGKIKFRPGPCVYRVLQTDRVLFLTSHNQYAYTRGESSSSSFQGGLLGEYPDIPVNTLDMFYLKDFFMKPGLSKGEMENSIRNAIIQFEQVFMGRGPTDVRAFILRDIILVRLKGVLTPAERQLAKSDDGIGMVKQMRQNLISQGRDQLCRQILEITGAETSALFTDIDATIGERIIVFTLDRDLEAIFT